MATQTTTQTSSLPPWLDTAYQDLLSRAGTASQQGYQPYVDASGNALPRVAGFSQDQLNAFQQVRDAQGRNDATFGQAQGMISGAGGLSSLAAAQPYITAAGGNFGSRAAQPYFDRAAGMSSFSAASPLLNQGAAVDAAAAANPLVTRGTDSWTNNVASYMSPYTQQVTDRIADLGARNLSEKLLPAVNKTFIGSGQFGSSRNSDFTNRAVRDTQEAILGQQSQALESGYKTAADIYGQDAGRALQGGLGLGQLTDANAQRQIQAGTQLGNMTNADANRLTQIGQSAGQLMAGDLDRQMQMASLAGGLANNDAARQLQAGNALSALGSSRQNYDLTQANALSGIGAQQQQLGQNSLDTMYGDFQTQQGWDKNNLSWLSSILSGTAKPGMGTTTTSAPGPSTGSQILGGLTSGVGLLAKTGAFDSGGWGSNLLSGAGNAISSAWNSIFAEGGRVKLAEGGLARPAYATSGAVDYTTMPDDVLRRAANGGDIGALREINRRQNPDRPGYRNLTGTKDQPYRPGYNQGAILPAIEDAGVAVYDEVTKPSSERMGLAPSLTEMRAQPIDYSGFSGAYPAMDEMPADDPDYSGFSGAYPSIDEMPPMGGLSAPIPGRKPTPPTASTITLPSSEYAVRQDSEGEVGPSPGPVPMGGLSVGAQPPAAGALRGGLSGPADAGGGGGSNRWGADSDIWDTLIAAGAGMMASKSPTMLGGVGEGLQAGLGSALAQKDRALKRQILERQLGNDDTRLGLERRRVDAAERQADRQFGHDNIRLGLDKRRVDLAEKREGREAANDLLVMAGAGDKNQPSQAKMIQFLMDGGMTREEATDRVFGAKTDPLERAKLVGNMAKIYAESGDDPDAALEKARKTVDMLAPPRTSAAKGVSSNPGIKVGTQAKRGDGSIIVWNGKSWVPQEAAQ